MTVAEMSKEFDVGYDNLTNNEGRGFSKWEKSIFLTQAQENLVDKYKPFIDTNEENAINLSELKEFVELTPDHGAEPRFTIPDTSTSYLFQLPVNYFYTLHERADIIFTDTIRIICFPTGLKGVWVKAITEDYFNSNIDNPFKKPYERLIWRIMYRRATVTSEIGTSNMKRVELIGDGDTNITNYSLSYIRRPNPIIIENLTTGRTVRGLAVLTECELDPSIHFEIVQEAIRIAAKATSDTQGYQIANLENSLSIKDRQ